MTEESKFYNEKHELFTLLHESKCLRSFKTQTGGSHSSFQTNRKYKVSSNIQSDSSSALHTDMAEDKRNGLKENTHTENVFIVLKKKDFCLFFSYKPGLTVCTETVPV
uniref:Uncharacterized protein n=1 Tax=Sphaerodactylus townsendi TaxID=933632 RepID=A0ACB8EL83_9SAUR